MDYWSKFDKMSRHVEENTISSSSKTLELLKRGISFFTESFSRMTFRQQTNDAVVRMALVSQNLNSLKFAVDAATHGYYIQSMVLMRNVYENWLAFWYLAKFPNYADIWLNPDLNRRPPKAETMRNKIDYTGQETKAKLHDYYAELNRFSHTDLIGVISRLRKDDGKTSVRVGVEYNSIELDACADSILFWLANMLIAIRSLMTKPDKDWIERYDSFLAEVNNFHKEFLQIAK